VKQKDGMGDVSRRDKEFRGKREHERLGERVLTELGDISLKIIKKKSERIKHTTKTYVANGKGGI